MNARSCNARSGAAIVLAMLLAALAAAVAATVFADQQRWSRDRRASPRPGAGAGAGARRRAVGDGRSCRTMPQHSTIDHLGEPWALPLPAIPLDNGEVRGAIEDAQGRLNVNALGETSARADVERARIARLFAQRGGPIGALDAIADWIDRDAIVREGGAEDAFYAARPRGGLPANAPVLRVAELSEVKGVTPRTLAPVAPFLTALPPATPLNVNTAPPEVLAAVVDKLGGEDLAKLLAARAQNPFNTVAEFRAQLPSSASPGSDETLSVKSDFFYVTIEAQQGATVARARALLRRKSGEWPEIVWQVVE